MSDKPILFTGAMVNSIIAGNKTLTSRARHNFKVGDGLWVKEKWGVAHSFDNCKPSEIIQRAAALNFQKAPKVYYSSDNSLGGEHGLGGLKTRPSLFMCRWMSRITLEVTEVFQYKLHDMTEQDAMAEGCVKINSSFANDVCRFEFIGVDAAYGKTAKHAYTRLLESMKIIDNEHENPYLFGVRFKVMEIKE